MGVPAQVAFMSFALGGTKAFSGRSMQAAHERLAAQQGMRMEHFDIVLEHLGAALHELGVPEVIHGISLPEWPAVCMLLPSGLPVLPALPAGCNMLGRGLHACLRSMMMSSVFITR